MYAATAELDRLFAAHAAGDGEAFRALVERLYGELKRIAHGQLRGGRPAALETTALVHEAFVKLVETPVDTLDRVHFLSLAARAMRQILVDYARQRGSLKRGSGQRPPTFDPDSIPVETIAGEMLEIDHALTRLASLDERLARVVELRFFGGLTEDEVAEALGVTTRTVRRDWEKARAFLYREMRGTAPP